MSDTSPLPATLLNAVREQRAVLFLGSGASRDAEHPREEKIPMGEQLRDMICDKFFNGALKDKALVAVSAMASNEVGLVPFQRYIREVFEPYQPASFHSLIPAFRWRAIATTNFDLIVERAYESKSAIQNLVKSVKDNDEFDFRSNNTSDPVGFYKLHGCIDHYSDADIPMVLGNEQYASYASNRGRFYGRFRDLAFECPIVFCGYSLSDPHIQQMIFDLTSDRISRPQYYCVAPNMNEIEVRYWAQHRITIIDHTFADFLKALDSGIPSEARALPRDLGGGELSLRTHYRIADANESDELRAYVAEDVQHVHAGMNSEPQTPADFYKGHDKGWGCIVQNLDARRAVVDSVLVDAVLSSEESSNSIELFMLKGPAGNGKSVALKRIAWEAATEYNKLAIFAQNAAAIRISPLEEIYSLTKSRIYLFIDHVSLYRNELKSLLEVARGKGIPISVIGTVRDNEWNIYCEGLEPFLNQDFPVRYLSEQEIRQLVALLDRHKSLGVLAGKPEDEQVDAFVSGAERQLLVALHEVTLGLPFQKIVFDEYRRIEPPEARRLYLNICALHQFGAPVRAGLISRVSGISFEQFKDRFLLPLENVVLVVEDRHTRDLSFKSRHSQVAQMVFSQAVPTAEEKYDLLVDLLDGINIDYSTDRETFGRMIKGRTIAETLANVDLGRLFYDRAEAAMPSEAFVPHQRAVFEMQHPGGSLMLAQEAARRAFELRPANQSIQHTQAEIARRLANTADDPLMKQSLRRIVRQKVGGGSRRASEYDLHTRARLSLDELREELTVGNLENLPAHVLEAAKDAEEAISRGLQLYPESSLLATVEAEYRDLVNQRKEAVRALEQAFVKNPRQDWLAVRLAKRYVEDGRTKDALQVLQRCLKDNPSSKIAHLEMARTIEHSGGDRGLILEHLARSFTDGDSNFESMFWFGRELFIQERFPESQSAFDKLNERAQGRFRRRPSAAIEGKVGKASEFDARVERLEEGYAFVRFDHLPNNVFAHRTDSDDQEWQALSTGSRIKAQIGFNRRGPRAMQITANSAQ